MVGVTEERFVRLASLGIIGLGVVAMVWAQMARPPNLALGREALASSEGWSTTPAAAVDGIRYGSQLGFHSAEEDAPWLAIDLGQPYALTRVAAYGRGDCCFDQSVPLAFEVSDDGAVYRQLDKRDGRFSQSDPWVIKLEHVIARYVRFRTLRRSFLVLSEVEVYGGRP
jgi:hypothetical protein